MINLRQFLGGTGGKQYLIFDFDFAYHVSDQYEACFYFSPNHNLRYLFLLTQVSLYFSHFLVMTKN